MATGDEERLDAVTIFAYRGRTPIQRIAYPLYVIALFAAVYGVSLSQGLAHAIAIDATRRELFQTWAPAATLLAVTILCPVAYAVGRKRGPVLPDLSFIDLLLPIGLDRDDLLRPWWRAALAAMATFGGIVGIVVGGGLAIRDLASPAAIAPIVLMGIGVGVLLTHIAVRAQARTNPAPSPWSELVRVADTLRALSQSTLRNQALLSRAANAAFLVGDLSHLARAVPSGRLRGRRLRLGAYGPLGTVVVADLLGWRRTPLATASGITVLLTGVPGTIWALRPEAWMALGPLLLMTSLGAGRLLTGLRFTAENAGSPTLLGISPRRMATGHLTVGLLPAATIGVASTVIVGPLSLATAAGVAGLMFLIAGLQLATSYRGGIRAERMSPTSGGQALAFHMAMPYAAPLAVGLLAGRIALAGGSPSGITLLALGLAVLAFGSWQLRERTRAFG
ncbi:hypothetical protein [Demetria terragena]|uniref:hypothetical protein n=1 Tax=Demetria terragena TaxID=63959 RepID=UPI000367B393|nr:hypothetical protein [Demetria terragena]